MRNSVRGQGSQGEREIEATLVPALHLENPQSIIFCKLDDGGQSEAVSSGLSPTVDFKESFNIAP
jgi:hypothetical protein